MSVEWERNGNKCRCSFSFDGCERKTWQNTALFAFWPFLLLFSPPYASRPIPSYISSGSLLFLHTLFSSTAFLHHMQWMKTITGRHVRPYAINLLDRTKSRCKTNGISNKPYYLFNAFALAFVWCVASIQIIILHRKKCNLFLRNAVWYVAY